MIITTGKGLGICLQEGGTAEFKEVIGKLGGGYQVKNGNVKLTPLMVNEVSVNKNGSYVIPEYLKTVLDVDGNTDLDIDVFENTGSEIRSTGKLKIKAENVIQSVCEQKYKSNEWYKASQTWSLSRNRHEKCYATKFSIPVMSAGEIEIQTTKDINLEGLITTEKDLKLMAGGDIRLASKAFYQEVDYVEELTGPLVDAKVRRIFSSSQIAPCIVRTGGDYIVEALGNYYQTGVHSKILGNKTVHAKNITSKPLRVRQSDTISGTEMENITIGLPSYITQPSFVLQFSNEGNRISNQPPLFQAFSDLFGSGSSARKTSALVRAGVEVYGLVKSVSDIMANSNDGLTAQKAGGIVAKLFGFGNFGISGTDIDQKTLNTYGIPSVDAVEGNLVYEAEETGNFTGHQASARNITLKGKKKLNLYADQEKMESSSESWKVTGGFNASELALHSGHSEAWSESQNVRYHPCSFVARENNIFESPKIYAENPLWRAQKNQIIGQADFVTKYNYSSGKAQAFNLGLSIGFEGGYPSAWLNFGFSRSNNYEETTSLSGVYGDVEIIGSLKNDSVPVHGEVQGDYSYSLRPMNHQRDGFGISGSLNVSSLKEFGKSAKNFAKSALAGFLASEVADQAGLGNSVASGIGTLAAAYVSDTNEGLTSQGHISWVHNEKEREIDLIGFNKEQFNAEMTQIKQTIFNEAVDDDVPQAVAQKIAEDKVTEIERDVATFKKRAEKVRELVEKAKKSEAKGKNVVEENTRSSADDTAVNWLLNPPSDEASTSGARMSELFHEVIREKGNLTPREEMLAYVPKNETEKALKETTLFRYEAEDLIAKHPEAADLCGKIFVGAMYGLQGAEYAGAAATGGPLAVAGKYVSQEAMSYAIDTTIEESTSKAVEGMAVSPTLREEFKTTLKVSAYTTLCAGSIKAAKKLSGTLAKSAKKGVLQKTFTKAEMKEILAGKKANDNVFLINDNGIYVSKGKVVNGESVGVGRVSSSVVGRASYSGAKSKSYNVGNRSLKGEKAPRTVSTRQDADNYINGLKGKLSQKGVTKDKHEYYKVMEKVEYKGIKFKKGDYLSRDTQHHEWEWFRGKDKHQGAIDSISGKLYKGADSGRTLKLP